NTPGLQVFKLNSDFGYLTSLMFNATDLQFDNISVRPAVIPSVAVSNMASAYRGQGIPLANLVAAIDPSSVGFSMLELWDSNGTAGGGQFVVNGGAQTGGPESDGKPGQVGNTVFDVRTLGGTDTLWARLQENDGSLTSWQSFTVTAPTPRLPSLSVSNDPTAARGQVINLANLVTISDPDAVGYQQLELWDSKGTPGGGQ